MPRLLLAAVVLAILAVCASAQTRAAFSPVGSPGRLAPGTLQTSLDDYAEDDGFAFDPGTFFASDDDEAEEEEVVEAVEKETELVDVSGGQGGVLPTASFWRAVADALGLDLLGNPQEGEETPAEETPLRLVPPKPTITKKRASSAGPNAFCLNVTEPRYYRAPTGCKCDCPGCNCRRYYACWDCDVLADGCLSQAAYLCDEGDFSFFNEELQACAWEQPRPFPYGCPPRPPGPPKPPKPPRPPAGPPRPESPPPIPGFPTQPPRPAGQTFIPQPGLAQPGQIPGQFPGQQPGVGVPGQFQPGVGVPGQIPGQIPGQFPGQFPGQPGQFQPGQQPGQFQPGGGANPGQQTQAGSCSSIPQCNSCLQTSDQSAFVCCCDAECTQWNPSQQGQPPGFLGCCNDYNQVCAQQQG